jgi:hypothetical protein
MGPRAIAVAIALAVAGALALAATGTSAPKSRLFRPGVDLAGVKLGMSKDDVLAAWGKRHGVCRSCPRSTWYFNYRPFTPEGAGVVFERGRVVHAFTVWRPPGWRTPQGLLLGAPASDVARLYGSLDRRQCTFYYALLKPGAATQTVFYVFGDRVWGFGLTRANASPCL